MPDFSQRSEAIEIMDDLNCAGPVVDQTLAELELINKWLGGNAVTLNGLNTILKSCHQNSLTIADLGCGGGDMLKLISDRLKQKNISIDQLLQYTKVHKLFKQQESVRKSIPIKSLFYFLIPSPILKRFHLSTLITTIHLFIPSYQQISNKQLLKNSP